MTPTPISGEWCSEAEVLIVCNKPLSSSFYDVWKVTWVSCRAPHEHEFLKKVEALSLPKTRLFIIVEMPLAVLSEAFPGLISLQTSSCKPSPSACTQRTLQREVSHVLREYTWKPKRRFRLWMLIFLLCISLPVTCPVDKTPTHPHSESGKRSSCRAAQLRLDAMAFWLWCLAYKVLQWSVLWLCQVSVCVDSWVRVKFGLLPSNFQTHSF